MCSTDDEHLVLRFELSTLDSEPGLVAYMNIFARTSEVVSKYTLKKVVEDWNVTPGDGHLYFTFRPPWVQSRPLDTYYSLHPEQRTFQDPRLKASRAAAAAAASDNGASLAGVRVGAARVAARVCRRARRRRLAQARAHLDTWADEWDDWWRLKMCTYECSRGWGLGCRHASSHCALCVACAVSRECRVCESPVALLSRRLRLSPLLLSCSI